MTDDRLYLIHVLECIARIEDYVSGGEDSFAKSSLVQDAVLRNLQTLAESTQRLADALKSEHGEVNWRRIAGLRNVLVHNYLGLDIPQVWQIIVRELPALKLSVEAMLRDV